MAFSHCSFQLPCCTVCTVAGTEVLGQKVKKGSCVQHRLMNKMWQVQNEDVKYCFKLLD